MGRECKGKVEEATQGVITSMKDLVLKKSFGNLVL